MEEDWRAFRARLVAGGIPTTTDADEPAPAAPPVEERQGLDEDNVKLATSQSKRQGDMLREGTWAHEVGAPEVGGLLLRLPLETQLAVAKDSHWGRRAAIRKEVTRAAMEDARRAAASRRRGPSLLERQRRGYRTAGRFLRRSSSASPRRGRSTGPAIGY